MRNSNKVKSLRFLVFSEELRRKIMKRGKLLFVIFVGLLVIPSLASAQTPVKGGTLTWGRGGDSLALTLPRQRMVNRSKWDSSFGKSCDIQER